MLFSHSLFGSKLFLNLILRILHLIQIMSKKLISGFQYLSASILKHRERIHQLQSERVIQKFVAPKLAIIQTSKNSTSQSFIRIKKLALSQAKMKVRVIQLEPNPERSFQSLLEVGNKIQLVNKNPKNSGIVLQLPVNAEFSKWQQDLINSISPSKDVDCLGDIRRKIFEKEREKAVINPCVVSAVHKILQGFKISLENKKILIIGNGRLTGIPLSIYFENKTKNLTIVNQRNSQRDILDHLKKSDIVISAVGKPNGYKPVHLKDGCIIFDIGCSPDSTGEMRGDFDENVKQEACSLYTPVPGGMGPIVTSCLLQNLYTLWIEQIKKNK